MQSCAIIMRLSKLRAICIQHTPDKSFLVNNFADFPDVWVKKVDFVQSLVVFGGVNNICYCLTNNFSGFENVCKKWMSQATLRVTDYGGIKQDLYLCISVIKMFWLMIGMFMKILNFCVFNKMVSDRKILWFPSKWEVNHLKRWRNGEVVGKKRIMNYSQKLWPGTANWLVYYSMVSRSIFSPQRSI